MSFRDLIKSSVFREIMGAGGSLGLKEILLILTVACLVGIYIFFVYKSFSKSAFYSKDLNITIAGTTIVVAAIMIAMQANLLVSLGMVGALSIVRFRTAVKNPLDLLYLFWSISGGIITGVGLYALAAVLCVIMTAAIALLGVVPNFKAPLVVIIKASANADRNNIENTMKQSGASIHPSSMRVRNGEMELIYEIKTSTPTDVVQNLVSCENVRAVNCLEHDGEIRG